MPHGFSKFMDSEGYSKETVTTYVQNLDRFFAFLDHKYKKQKELHEISTTDITDFLNSKKDAGLTVPGINKYLTILKSFFDFAEREGKVGVDPACKIKGFKGKVERKQRFCYENLLKIRDHLLSSSSYSNLTKALFIMGLHGCRFKEIQIKKDDVIQNGDDIVLITKTHGNEIRQIHLKGIEADAFYQHYMDMVFIPTDYMFVQKKHGTGDYTPIEITNFYYRTAAVSEDFNLPHFNLESTRMAYVEYLYKKKRYSIEKLSKELGVTKPRAAVLAKESIERSTAV